MSRLIRLCVCLQLGQMPILDYLFGTMTVTETLGYGFAWASAFIQERYQERTTEPPQTAHRTTDFMDRVIQAQAKFPEIVDNVTATIYLLANVVAGSDTTASSMSSSIYHVLKHPGVHARLCHELDNAKLSLPARWRDLQQLPYFNAVMREAKRIHPGVGMMLERVVPAGGLSLPDGRFVPEGTIVGINPSVVNRDLETFGPDTDQFVPERWLRVSGETEEACQSRLTRMQRAILTFGAGPRSCVGKNFSEVESDKVVATLFAKYKV